MSAFRLEVGPLLRFPAFPARALELVRSAPETKSKVRRDFRHHYDWTIFTPEGLVLAERYWDRMAEQLSVFLPEHLYENPSQWRGMNLGTFNGSYQKAWMRRGYAMCGVEKVQVIEELIAYGCEGCQDDVFFLSKIADESFDFAVLDRVICHNGFYSSADVTSGATPPAGCPPYFRNMFRILKQGGALIGVLYNWYTRVIVEELASYGKLKVWPFEGDHLGFCVVKGRVPTALPDVHTAPLYGGYFTVPREKEGKLVARFLPSNELVREDEEGRREIEFAPPLLHSKTLKAEALRAAAERRGRPK